MLSFAAGPLDANCYYWENETESAVIDPSDADVVLGILSEHRRKLTAILLTHRHYDHLAGVARLKAETGARVYVHALDACGLSDRYASLCAMIGGPFSPCEPDVLLRGGETIDCAGERLRVLHTPGHTVGGVSFVSDARRCVFTGDTIFYESVGRTDFPTGSVRSLRSSAEQIFRLPEDYAIYPGHGPKTAVAHERTHNPILSIGGKEWFN